MTGASLLAVAERKTTLYLSLSVVYLAIYRFPRFDSTAEMLGTAFFQTSFEFIWRLLYAALVSHLENAAGEALGAKLGRRNYMGLWGTPSGALPAKFSGPDCGR